MTRSSIQRLLCFALAFFALTIPASAQTIGRPSRVTEQVDQKNLAELKGHTHPLPPAGR